MSKILFIAAPKKVYDGDYFQIGNNQVRLIFHDDIPSLKVLLSGFNLVNEHNGIVQTNRDDYKYLYRTYEDDPKKVELCNDNVPWVAPPEPEPQPEPEPYVPTLEEVKEAKVKEMFAISDQIIQSGIDVTLSDGTIEHFTLTEKEQAGLSILRQKVSEGEKEIPWHTSDEDEHCKYYSNSDMNLITTAALNYATWHETYFRDLRIYIRSLDSKEAVDAVTYGMEIPVGYRSEPLKAMMAAQEEA